MKKYFLIAILFVSSFPSLGQSENSCYPTFDSLIQKEVYKHVDKMPNPSGGMEELFKLISGKIKYEHIKNRPIQSRVVVAFVIDIDGKAIGKRVVQDIENTPLAEKVLEVLDDVKWEPGSCNGEIVPVYQLLPVNIELK